MAVNRILLILLCLCKKEVFSQLSLTSIPDVNRHSTVCPGPIEFTCRGDQVPLNLTWLVNGSKQITYTFQPSDVFPKSLLIQPPLLGVQIQITSALLDNDTETMNITSTLSGSTSNLSGFPIQCASMDITSGRLQIASIGAPPPTLNCDLRSFAEGPGVLIRWSSYYTSQFNISRYRVLVKPATSSCPSNQILSPTDSYNCSGILSGTHYNFTISAINCGDLGRSSRTICAQISVPSIPTIIGLIPSYSRGELNEIIAVWNLTLIPLPEDCFSCFYDRSLNYKIHLENSYGNRVQSTTIHSRSGSCNSDLGICFTSFFPPSAGLSERYRVRISATNIVGGSGSAVSEYVNSIAQECHRNPVPTPSLFVCYFLFHRDGPALYTRWSPSFSLQHNVSRYRVRVNPASPLLASAPPTSSCPSNQIVSSTDRYNCSRLVLGTRYHFSVSAINCGSLEGPITTFCIQPSPPQAPVVLGFDHSYNTLSSALHHLTVYWKALVHSSEGCSNNCVFITTLNYTVIFENSAGVNLHNIVVYSSSSNCNTSVCSTSFFPSFSDQTSSYRVLISAANIFGVSDTTISRYFVGVRQELEPSNATLIEHTLCTLILCIVFATVAVAL